MTYDASGLIGPQPQHSETLWRSLQTNGFALDLSATGTGKTYCAASVAKNDGSPLVLICPKSVLKTWTSILATYGVKPKVAINYELLDGGMAVELRPDEQGQGLLSAVLEFGQGRNAPRPHILPQGDREAPVVERFIADVIAKRVARG